MDIQGKRIVVTGAASGIGLEVLRQLAEFPGTQIVGADLEPAGIPQNRGTVYPFRADMGKPEEIEALFAFAIEKMGGIDIFIANAGFAYYEQLGAPDWRHIQNIFAVNVAAPIYSAQKMHTLYKRDYLVVITASAMSYMAMPGYTIYSATKAALERFAEGWRLEPDKKESRIMMVYPIGTRTDFFNSAPNTQRRVPMPFPTQTPGYVAQRIVNGIQKDRKRVSPSVAFRALQFIERFVPGARWPMQWVHLRQFKRWLLD